MPIYLFCCPKCGKEQDVFFKMSETDKREAGVPCKSCDAICHRVFTANTGFIKNTYVGDVFDKGNCEPVKPPTYDPVTGEVKESKSWEAQKERVKQMRKESAKKKKSTKIQSGYGAKYKGSRFE